MLVVGCSLDKKRKCSNEEPAASETNKQLVLPSTEPEQTLRVLMSEPILIQEATPSQVDNQKAITVQVIGFMQ
jgi:hypothetical protein